MHGNHIAGRVKHDAMPIVELAINRECDCFHVRQTLTISSTVLVSLSLAGE